MSRLVTELSCLFDQINEPVVAVRDGEIQYFNSAAMTLFPQIGVSKIPDFLPAQALDGPGENFRGEVTVEGRRTGVAVSTIAGHRICVFSVPMSDGRAELAELLSAAGVEMNNVLAVMKMATGLLLPNIEDIGNPRLNRYASMVYHSVYCMLRMTRNLVDLGLIIRGETALTRARYDIVASGRALIGSASHLLGDSAAELRFESNADSIMIFADRYLLEKLLLNLLSNSVQHTERGGVITVSVVSAVDRVLISVSDNGEGISHSVLPTAWNRYSAPKDLTEKTGGIGLGLTLVQNIARLHGGSAVFETRPGEGTTVTVSLPAERPETRDFEAQMTDSDGAGMEQLLTELSGVIGYEKYSQLYMD